MSFARLQFTAGIVILFLLAGCSHRSGKPKVLIFTKTAGFHHSSIPTGVQAITKLANQNNFDADTSSDAARFQEDSLKKYAAVIFLNTTGDLLNNYQEADFERYIQAGGGYMGIHAATDAEYDWGWYGRLAGAYFNGHPEQQEAIVKVTDASNDATRHLPAQWKRKDEWYNFKKINKDIHVLLSIDEKSYAGGTNGVNHPLAWYHDFDGGRAFYTELGHTEESYADSLYLKHLLGGIKYAIGNNKELDYAKATTLRVPEENRFVKVALTVGGKFFEPIEMSVLPNSDVLIIQRRGEVLLYKNTTKTLTQAGFLSVYYRALNPGGSTEEGLLGLQADPDFASNHFVYMYYAPADSALSVDRLSRFTLINDTLDMKSEKPLLEVQVEREICCHTGGSIAFGKDHNLFVSTGDNSTPFDEKDQPFNLHSFAPLDDRPGFRRYDSRRGAGNTNDLRGKILRIKIDPNGTYTIPEGNLFVKGTDKTRPEIYVMGDRNPYRISVDKKNGYLYWGEVGPDANNDSLDTRGPKGYDEINQAQKAGNFGWPYFVGNNYAYHEYDFATGKPGPAFDPQKPLNHSKNNTGLVELPAAQPAFIWYPYGESKDFPQVGTGGRTAMAGPVYYTDLFPDSARYPQYYSNKLFIYDWIRGWIKAVTMLPDGSFDKMEPFMAHTKFNSPIDMETGPDGRLYILEYGTGWNTKNPDAGLFVVDYLAGNRPPSIGAPKLSATAGKLPFKGTVNVEASDPENDGVSYTWNFGNGVIKETNKPEVSFEYTTAGEYKIFVEARDSKGAVTKSDAVQVVAGNEIPEVSIAAGGNKSFYLPGKPVPYVVSVDHADASPINPANLFVSSTFTENARNATKNLSPGEIFTAGKLLTQTLDCKSCHKENEKSAGPSFTQVAEKYGKKGNTAMGYLMEKVMKGGSGVWGQAAMSAHPDIDQKDLKQILQYVLSLAAKDPQRQSLPVAGKIIPPNDTKRQTLVLSAVYYNRGTGNVKALSGKKILILPPSYISFKGTEEKKGLAVIKDKDQSYFEAANEAAWFALDSIDLTNVSAAYLSATGGKSNTAVEIRLDAPGGIVIGKGTIPPGKNHDTILVVQCPLAPATDNKFHKLYFLMTPVTVSADSKYRITGVQFK
jgi:cytochrome c